MKKTDRPWVSLLAFFAVVTLGSSLIFAAVFAGVTAVLAGGESAQASDNQPVDPLLPGQTFSGVISDSHCGARHTDSGKSASECARMCVRNGSRYVLVNGNTRYELIGTPGQFDKFAAERVSPRWPGINSRNPFPWAHPWVDENDLLVVIRTSTGNAVLEADGVSCQHLAGLNSNG